MNCMETQHYLSNGHPFLREEPKQYFVNGRPVSKAEWDALPKRMEWGAMTPPMTFPTWDPRSTLLSQGREMTREEWNAVNKVSGSVEVSLRDMRLKQKPSGLTREVFSKIAKDTYAEMNRIEL